MLKSTQERFSVILLWHVHNESESGRLEGKFRALGGDTDGDDKRVCPNKSGGGGDGIFASGLRRISFRRTLVPELADPSSVGFQLARSGVAVV
ncbi:hypothetical protein IAQ61_003497 [Plenodomus lingam]|uniref:uncharacterized protein n=1 Tax=Leptosphaeria maculans TaxID=5022 RepID=UPI00331C60DF|nr:hypothetical protein IAQ61_003497 [Plenodomus lingam]